MSARDENVVRAFSLSQAAALSGLSFQRLTSWNKRKFFRPSFTQDRLDGSKQLVYSFKDIAALRVLRQLRDHEGVTLAHLEQVKSKLAQLSDNFWSQTTIYVFEKRVVLEQSANRAKADVITGQCIIDFPLKDIHGKLSEDVDRLLSTRRGNPGEISRKRAVARNKSVFEGTRISIDSVRDYLDAGYSYDAIIEEFPTLSRGDIEAAVNEKNAA